MTLREGPAGQRPRRGRPTRLSGGGFGAARLPRAKAPHRKPPPAWPPCTRAAEPLGRPISYSSPCMQYRGKPLLLFFFFILSTSKMPR